MMDFGGVDPHHPSLIFLHGFMGEPTDWRATVEKLIQKYQFASTKIVCIDFTRIPEISPSEGLENWGKHFLAYIKKQFPEWKKPNTPSHHQPLLIGYSLGARLALHAHFAEPSFWSGLVCLSGHPGLPSPSPSPNPSPSSNPNQNAATPNYETQIKVDNLNFPTIQHKERWLSDQIWAQRFISEDWSQLMKSWNQQAVFNKSIGSETPPSFQISSDPGPQVRNILSLCLQNWSLALQKDFRLHIASHAERILWLVGDCDVKFSSVAKDLKQENDRLQVDFIKNGGHRIHLSHPEEVAELVNYFIGKLENVPSHSRRNP